MKRTTTRLATVPPSAEGIYRAWLAMFPETRQHATIDFFYAFVRSVLHSTRLRRDGHWLAQRLKIDAPELSADAVAWYSERFDIALEYDRSVPRHSQPLRQFVRGRAEEDFEALRAGLIEPGQRLTEIERREMRQRHSEKRSENPGGGQDGGQHGG